MNHEWATYKSSHDNLFFEGGLTNVSNTWTYSRCKNCKVYLAALIDKKNTHLLSGYFLEWNGEILFIEDNEPSCAEMIMKSVME